MKHIRKAGKRTLSLLLALMMLISCFGAGLTAFATDMDPYNQLIDALQADGVKNASWGSPQNYIMVVNDPTGDIEKAAEAFWKVAEQEAPNHTGDPKGDDSSRTAFAVAETIVTKLQNEYNLSGDALAHARTVLNNFVGQMSGANFGSGQPKERTYGVKVMRDMTGWLLSQPGDVTKLPDTVNTTVSYTWYHPQGQSGSLFSRRYYNYLKSWNRVEGDTDGTKIAELKAFGAYFTDKLLKTDLDKMTSEELAALVDANRAAVDACSLFSNDEVMNHFFDKAAIKTFILDATTARDKQFAVEYAGKLAECMKNNVKEMDHDALAALLDEMTALYAQLNGCTSDAIAYAMEKTGITRENLNAYIISVNEEKEVLELTGFKATLDELIDATNVAEVDDDTLTAALAVAQEQFAMVQQRTPAAIDRVFTNGVEYVSDFIHNILVEMDARKLSTEIADYYAYFTDDLLSTDLTKLSTDELIDVHLIPANEKVAALEKYEQEAIDRVFGDKYPAVKAYVASIDETLTNRMNGMLDEMLAEYAEFGRVTLLNYKQVRDIANQAVANARIMEVIEPSAEMQEKFNKCRSFLEEVQSFVNSNGYTGYVKTEMQYPVRNILPGDIARTEGEEYAVTNEKLEEVIAKLDGVMNNDKLGGLLGTEGSISDLIRNALETGVYTNDLINQVVSIYPLLINTLKDLVLTEIAGQPLTGAILLGAFESLGVYIYPDNLAAKVIDGNRYPEAKAALAAAGHDWANYEGNVDWHVTDKDSFVAALSHVLGGLTPILRAALTANNFDGKATIIVSADVHIDAMNLYTNAVLPLLEALECEGVVSSAEYNTYTTSDQLLGAVLTPLLNWVDGVVDAPVAGVLDVLPKLAYILEFGMINEILSSTRITVTIKALFGIVNLDVMSLIPNTGDGTIMGLLTGGLIPGFDFNPAVLSDVNLLLPWILSLVAPEAQLVLPTINQAVLASHGTMNAGVPSGRPGGTRYQLVTDKADTLLAVMRYVLPLLSDKDFLDSVFALVGTITGSEIQLSDDILAILKNLGDNPDNVVAAVTELFVPQDYAMKKMTYAYSEQAEEVIASGEGTGAVINNVTYSDAWTKEKAQYISDNLADYIDSIMLILGGKDTLKLSEMIRELITGKIYTNETVTSLVLMVKDLLASLGDTDLKPIFALAGVDISSWDKVTEGYQWGFEDGDKDGFAAALTEALSPITPVLATVLADKDLVVLDAVTANGYPGYRDGVIPLLENLGCNPADIMTYDAYKAAVEQDSSVALSAILKPVLNLIEEIYNAPIDKLIEILPNILYFLNNDGLQVCVDNTAKAVFVLLDTVRPVYSLEFNLNLDLKQILLELLSGLEVNGQPINLKIPFLADLNMLTVGTVTPYISASGEKAYRLEQVDKADFVTVVMRNVIELAFYEDNINTIVDLIAAKAGMSDDVKKSLSDIANTFAKMYQENNGVDKILNATYVIFQKTDSGMDNSISAIKDFNERWNAVFEALNNSGNADLANFAQWADKVLDMISLGFITGDGVGTNGLIDFFKRLSALFQRRVTDVSIDRTRAELLEGNTLTLNVTIKPDWAKNKDVIWASSNENVATVENGVVTAVAPGDVMITAVTADGGFEVSCVVNVRADKAKLNSTIALVKSLIDKKPEGVDEALWTELETSLARAELVANDIYVGQADVNAAEQALFAAYDALGLYTRITGVSLSYQEQEIEGNDLCVKIPWQKQYKSQSVKLDAIILPNGADCKSITWTVSGNQLKVAQDGTVTPTGKGVGARSGEVTITATDYEGNTFTDTVNVRFIKWDWQR